MRRKRVIAVAFLAFATLAAAQKGQHRDLRKDLSGKNQASSGVYFDPASGTFKRKIPVVEDVEEFPASFTFRTEKPELADEYGNYFTPRPSTESPAPLLDYDYFYEDEVGPKNGPGSQHADKGVVYQSYHKPEDIIIDTKSNSYLRDHYTRQKQNGIYDYSIGDDDLDDLQGHKHEGQETASSHNYGPPPPPALVYDYTIGDEVNNKYEPPIKAPQNNLPVPTVPSKSAAFDKPYVFPTRHYPIYSVRPRPTTTISTSTTTESTVTSENTPGSTGIRWRPKKDYADIYSYKTTERTVPFIPTVEPKRRKPSFLVTTKSTTTSVRPTTTSYRWLPASTYRPVIFTPRINTRRTTTTTPSTTTTITTTTTTSTTTSPRTSTYPVTKIPVERKTPKYKRKIPRIIEKAVGVRYSDRDRQVAKTYPADHGAKFPHFPARNIGDGKYREKGQRSHDFNEKRSASSSTEAEGYDNFIGDKSLDSDDEVKRNSWSKRIVKTKLVRNKNRKRMNSVPEKTRVSQTTTNKVETTTTAKTTSSPISSYGGSLYRNPNPTTDSPLYDIKNTVDPKSMFFIPPAASTTERLSVSSKYPRLFNNPMLPPPLEGYVAPDLYGQQVPRKPTVEHYYDVERVEDPFYPNYEAEYYDFYEEKRPKKEVTFSESNEENLVVGKPRSTSYMHIQMSEPEREKSVSFPSFGVEKDKPFIGPTITLRPAVSPSGASGSIVRPYGALGSEEGPKPSRRPTNGEISFLDEAIRYEQQRGYQYGPFLASPTQHSKPQWQRRDGGPMRRSNAEVIHSQSRGNTYSSGRSGLMLHPRSQPVGVPLGPSLRPRRPEQGGKRPYPPPKFFLQPQKLLRRYNKQLLG